MKVHRPTMLAGWPGARANFARRPTAHPADHGHRLEQDLLLGLTATTVLAYVARPRPRALVSVPARAQLVVWAAMAVFRVFLVDVGDVDGSDLAVFTRPVGRNDATLGLSWTVVGLAALLAVGSYRPGGRGRPRC